MLSKKCLLACGMVVCLLLFLGASSPANSADTTAQILSQVDQILKENPLKAGDKVQTIKIAEDATVTFFLTRMAEGFELKPHFHKTHDESVYVIKGAGQMLVNDKWVDVKPGTIHFNPMGKVHATKNTSHDALVIISIFTPGMKEPDRQFVQ